MIATWFQGPAQKFIEASRECFERSVNILHQHWEFRFAAQAIVDDDDGIPPLQSFQHGRHLHVGFVTAHERAAVDGHDDGKGAVAFIGNKASDCVIVPVTLAGSSALSLEIAIQELEDALHVVF